MELTAKMMRSRRRMGMRYLLNFSMPLETPPMMTAVAMTRVASLQRTSWVPLLSRCPNVPLMSAADMSAKALTMESCKNLSDQPPTTI